MNDSLSIIINKDLNEAKKAVKSGLSKEGFEIIAEIENDEAQEIISDGYRIIFDCNARFAQELEQRKVVPNIPCCNAIISRINITKSEINFIAPENSMTNIQSKRLVNVVPLLYESINNILNGLK